MTIFWWAVAALVISIVAGATGFGGVAGNSATVAKTLFGVFLAVFLVLFALIVFGLGAVLA